MTRRFLLLFLPAIACVAAGCSREGTHEDSAALTFRVDSTRLGERFERADVGVTLRAPAGWTGLPDSLIDAAMLQLREQETAPIGQTLLALYRQADAGGMLAVTRYDRELGPAARDSVALLHLQRLKAEHPTGQVEDGRFTYHGFEIVQLRAVDSTMVGFKLLLSRAAHPLVQLDYVVPRNVYPRELESIESSIGSLEPKS